LRLYEKLLGDYFPLGVKRKRKKQMSLNCHFEDVYYSRNNSRKFRKELASVNKEVMKNPGQPVVSEAKPRYKSGIAVSTSQKHTEAGRKRTEKSVILSTNFTVPLVFRPQGGAVTAW
jgi:hypothetical protein